MKHHDKLQSYALAEKLLSEQNFAAAIIVGAIATFFAAILYSIIVSRWDFSYGFAAAGVGVIVALPMQYLGRGIDLRFAVAASVYTIAGCILGNVFRIVLNPMKILTDSPMDALHGADFSTLSGHLISVVSLVDLVFWFVAVFAAAFLARRPLSRSDRLALGLYAMKS
ncbi:MAG TPA: hypothetical protein PKH39_05000 [Woeseiaceae bacterium]|nr:hypothetical protein [Woeseiaceae bacterium]